MVKYGFFYKKFLSLVERRQAWYWEIGNVAKGAILKKLKFSIINLRMKKLPKQDEFGILGTFFGIFILSQHCQFLNIPVFFSKTSDFVVGSVLEFRLRLNI
jgi:hypothetical protein